MKARQSFEIVVDKLGNRVQYYEGDNKEVKKILVNAGDDVEKAISKEQLTSILASNPDFFILEEVSAPKTKAKLSDEEFLALSKKFQQLELKKHNIAFDNNLKEKELLKLYRGN